MDWKWLNSPDSEYTPAGGDKPINKKLIKVLDATYEFPLEESVKFLKPLTRDPFSNILDTQSLVPWLPKPITGSDIKVLQKEIIKDIRLTEPYRRRAHVFLGDTTKDKLKTLKESGDYEKALLVARHVHNYVRHIYKIDMKRLGI